MLVDRFSQTSDIFCLLGFLFRRSYCFPIFCDSFVHPTTNTWLLNVHIEQYQSTLTTFPSTYLDARVSAQENMHRNPKAGANLPLDMTLFSAHHSPSTVNRKAKELVIGTVRLSSSQKLACSPCKCLSKRHGDKPLFTSLSNDKKEPQTSG